MSNSLIIDANNLLYRTFFAHKREPEDMIIGMAHHSALWTCKKYFREYQADEIVMAFDSKSWRKIYTEDLSKCVTYKKYKGNRRQNLTHSEEQKLQKFDAHINEFAEIMREHTSILVLKQKYLEADDLIAGYVQSNPDMSHVLITSDYDYVQLLGKHKINIIDPDSGKPRSLSEWDNDPEYFMFEKCIRGDTSDNVMSAYPRLRSTKIKEAYRDEYARQNIMNNKFKVITETDGESITEKEFITSEVFEENNLLMNLEAQPDYIRDLINNTIEKSILNKGKFNYVKFLQFCKKNELKNILDKIDEFVPMLACKRN